MRINRFGKRLQIIDPDRIPSIPVREILKELLIAHIVDIPELFPQVIGMPFDDLSHAEAGDDLLLRGGRVNEHKGCGFVLENLLAELVLFCSAQDLFHVL